MCIVLLIVFIILFIFALDDKNFGLAILCASGIIITLGIVLSNIDQKLMKKPKEYSSSKYNLEYRIVTIEEHGVEKKDTIYILTNKELIENPNQ